MRTMIKSWSVLASILAVLCLLPSITMAQAIITNGQVIVDLSSTGSQKQYKIAVPAGATNLEIKIWGGSGDCDLYVKRGSQPTTTRYDYRPFLCGNNETVKIKNPTFSNWFIMLNAFCPYDGLSLRATYDAVPARVATPIITPPGGTYFYPRLTWILCVTRGATIRYTTDGSDPTSSSTIYSNAITVRNSMTLKATAFKSGMTPSSIATARFTITVPSRVATPTFSPRAGAYTSPQSVSISCATACSIIRYTTNGVDPTLSSATYIRPIVIDNSTTIKAKAFRVGMTESYTASAAYTIIPPTPITMANNTPLQNISDAQGGQKYFMMSVPSGQTRLVIKILGGNGDCDLYVKRGALPTMWSYDYRPYVVGNNETVTVCNPSPGDWYIMLRAYSDYSGVSLIGRFF